MINEGCPISESGLREKQEGNLRMAERQIPDDMRTFGTCSKRTAAPKRADIAYLTPDTLFNNSFA